MRMRRRGEGEEDERRKELSIADPSVRDKVERSIANVVSRHLREGFIPIGIIEW